MINASAQRLQDPPTPPIHNSRGRRVTAQTEGAAPRRMPQIIYRRRNPSPNISRAAIGDTSPVPRGVGETRRDLAQKK